MSDEKRETYIQPHHQSSINMCLRCKRAYMFRYRWCIFPKQRPFAKAANQGTITHWLIDAGPEGVEEVRMKIRKRIQHLVVRIDAGEDLLGYLVQEANELDNQFNKALVMASILWEKYPRPDHHKVLAKEEMAGIIFRLDEPSVQDNPFPTVNINLEGRLDEIVLDTKTDLIYIRDYKTTGRDVDYTLTGYQYSLQCRIYRLLAGAFLQTLPDFKDRSPDGFILEILQVPSIVFGGKDRDYTEHEHTLTRGPRKGEIEIRRDYDGDPKFENYLKRCQEWYKEQEHDPVQSFAIRFTESVLPDELRHDLQLAAIYQVLPAEPQHFPRDETTSYCKYMEKVCPYYDLCSTDEASWPAIIEGKYEVRPPKETEEKEPEDEDK